MKLSDFSYDVFSQFGEDGIVEHIFSVIGTKTKQCVEFGAGDGQSCSSTMDLWRNQNWKALLVESDPVKFEQLQAAAKGFDTVCRREIVTPTGDKSISELLNSEGFDTPDYMSIDIDGEDYHVFKSLTCKPRVIGIEFNPTIPPHIDMYQTSDGDAFGASVLSLVNLGEVLDYEFVGATYCNAFFVRKVEAKPFRAYEKDLTKLFSYEDYMYVVTDFAGRATMVGQPLPWGLREPYVKLVESSHSVFPPTDGLGEVIRGFESVYGPSLIVNGTKAVSVDGVGIEALDNMVSNRSHMWVNGKFTGRKDQLVVSDRPDLVCFDVSTSSKASIKALGNAAHQLGYGFCQVGNVLAIIKEFYV